MWGISQVCCSESFPNAALKSNIFLAGFSKSFHVPSLLPSILPSQHRKRSNMFPSEAASGTSPQHGADNANPIVQEDS